MWTKSFIQLQVESIQERAKFANDITKILEKYQIPDGVFGISNNNTYELSSGYFVEEKTLNSSDTLVIRPSVDLGVKHMEKDLNKVKMMYELGRNDALEMLDKLKEFWS